MNSKILGASYTLEYRVWNIKSKVWLNTDYKQYKYVINLKENESLYKI